ncbi:DUF2163 domain-containing protein [Marivita hallyeonensis]|uniref:Bacteriophage phiJL001 Gp84 C-terminal domain-containing protein n=1 Tax=Marivita hallyeonensis TaxID=996342 RepID=A0A1M5RN38_9RHOB|nr:DUF2163 domain-containing protein [Marivita hallyeonensis]SHH27682.1 phage conserved hypothetical protein BR0599 [Marivita hallyeonensis]
MPGAEALYAHLAQGVTTVARCWEVRRSDGQRLGFTDHDLDLTFDDLVFRAETGMSAAALQQGTGLAVDNSEAVGALSDASVTETDIAAGRFDGAEVIAWLVNWADVSARKVLFRGSLGEITRTGNAYSAELRGLTEWLNRPVGRVFQHPCSAVLGDSACGVDLSDPALRAEATVVENTDRGGVVLLVTDAFDAGWFQRGRLNVLDGDAEGLWASLKRDVLFEDGTRQVDFWEPFRAQLAIGTRVELVTGCDKRFETCRTKFDNLLNYQGFPDIPQEEWIMVHPTMTSKRDGGSLR